jgi:hypothetical protein
MYRRAQLLLIGTALLVGIGAIVLANYSGHKLVDPDGSFLGPSWARLPILLGAAIGIDLIPRTLWLSRFRPKAMPGVFRERLRSHWNRDRLTLVALGVVCFYIVYVGYRNMKSALPFVISTKYDHDLELIDTAILFGHHPAAVMQNVFGDGVLAYLFSYIYLWFLPLVPIAVTIWLVWSRNLAYGYWFVGSQCIAWTLGTISYYALPTLGPGIAYPYLYSAEPDTPARQLMDALVHGRQNIKWDDGVVDAVQSVAGFASLHCAITMLVALMVQYTVRSRALRIFFWCNFAITALATLYFGWHSLSDDVAGIMIALVSFYVAGLAAGQKFERKGLRNLQAEGDAIEAKEALARS